MLAYGGMEGFGGLRRENLTRGGKKCVIGATSARVMDLLYKATFEKFYCVLFLAP
jgi:hypothetical protein